MPALEYRITRVSDANDPRIADYRDIRERDLVTRQGRFIAEGKTVLQVLVDQGRFPVQSLLILENRLAGLAGLIDRLEYAVPVYVVGQEVMDAIAGFHMHRGVLALGRTPTEIEEAARISDHWKTVIVLSEISNHDNMGAIFRNAAAFGVDAVFMDAQCCDPLYRKAIRVSVGGVLRVPYHRFATLEEAASALDRNGFEIAALSPSGAMPLSKWQPARRQAVVLGSEGPGLPKAWLQRLRTLTIPMARGFDSLNVATAGAIALHHLAAARH